MFEIIYHSPLVLQVALTVGVLSAVTLAATLLTIAIKDSWRTISKTGAKANAAAAKATKARAPACKKEDTSP